MNNMKSTSKIILGLTGDRGVGKTTVADILVGFGAYRISLSEKVEQIANHIVESSAMEKEKDKIIARIRERGYVVHKSYWLNMALMSVPENCDVIVIDDAKIEDSDNNILQLYQIVRPGFTKVVLNDIPVISNNGDIEVLSQKIFEFCQSLGILSTKPAK